MNLKIKIFLLVLVFGVTTLAWPAKGRAQDFIEYALLGALIELGAVVAAQPNNAGVANAYERILTKAEESIAARHDCFDFILCPTQDQCRRCLRDQAVVPVSEEGVPLYGCNEQVDGRWQIVHCGDLCSAIKDVPPCL